jgi:hypothetical protein
MVIPLAAGVKRWADQSLQHYEALYTRGSYDGRLLRSRGPATEFLASAEHGQLCDTFKCRSRGSDWLVVACCANTRLRLSVVIFRCSGKFAQTFTEGFAVWGSRRERTRRSEQSDGRHEPIRSTR